MSINSRFGFIGIDIYHWGINFWIELGPDARKLPPTEKRSSRA